MAKTKISEYDVVASNNTDVDGINIAESCPPSGINNAIREVMAHLKDFQSGASGDTLPVASGGTGSGTASGARTNLGLGTVSTLNSIATANIDADAINGTKIADDSIDSEHYVDDSIDTAHLADDAVTSAKIAENAVDATALNVSGNGTSGQVLESDGDGSFSWGTGGQLGVGQTWQDVSASRSGGVTYTNSTGKPIQVMIQCHNGVGGDSTSRFDLVIDGITIVAHQLYGGSDIGLASVIVPNTSTYRMNVNPGGFGGASIGKWLELR